MGVECFPQLPSTKPRGQVAHTKFISSSIATTFEVTIAHAKSSRHLLKMLLRSSSSLRVRYSAQGLQIGVFGKETRKRNTEKKQRSCMLSARLSACRAVLVESFSSGDIERYYRTRETWGTFIVDSPPWSLRSESS